MTVGAFFFRYRNVVFPCVFAGLAFGTRPRIFPEHPAYDFALDGLGLVLALAGQAVRAAAVGLDYIDRGGKGGKVSASRLVEGGMFALSRNPLYVGNILVVAGLVAIHAGPWMLFGTLPFFLVAYRAIVAEEERYLLERFGSDYEDYCRRVPRFLPRPTGWRTALGGMRFDWARVVRKEYGSAFAWGTAAIALLARESLAVAAPAGDAVRWQLVALAGVWVLLVGAYLSARHLKKSGILPRS